MRIISCKTGGVVKTVPLLVPKHDARQFVKAHDEFNRWNLSIGPAISKRASAKQRFNKISIKVLLNVEFALSMDQNAITRTTSDDILQMANLLGKSKIVKEEIEAYKRSNGKMTPKWAITIGSILIGGMGSMVAVIAYGVANTQFPTLVGIAILLGASGASMATGFTIRSIKKSKAASTLAAGLQYAAQEVIRNFHACKDQLLN